MVTNALPEISVNSLKSIMLMFDKQPLCAAGAVTRHLDAHFVFVGSEIGRAIGNQPLCGGISESPQEGTR